MKDRRVTRSRSGAGRPRHPSGTAVSPTLAWITVLALSLVAPAVGAATRTAGNAESVVGETEPQARQAARTRHFEAETAANGRTVRVDASASRLEVAVGSGDRVRVVADLEYWSNETEWMAAVEEEFDVALRETGDRIEIEPTELPELGRQGWFERLFSNRRISYDLTLSLEVPRGTPVELANRYGDVIVRDVGGPLTVVNASGAVTVTGTRGETRLENRYGDLSVADVDGPLDVDVGSGAVEVVGVTGDAHVRGRYGDVTVRDVDGRLELRAGSSDVVVERVGAARITSSYGDARVREVAGPLEIDVSSGGLSVSGVDGRLDASNSYATVELTDVEGDLVYRGSSVSGSFRRIAGTADVTGSYGDLVLEQIGGVLTVQNTSGGITVTDAGPATLEGSYAPIRAQRIRGDLRVSATSAAVVAQEIAGGVDVRTSYDSVRIDGVRGPVAVVDQSGRVEVTGFSGDALAATHRIETSYADVEVAWPRSADLRYRLASTYGEIRADLPGAPQERGSRRVLEGRTSEGAAAGLDVSVQSGSIVVRRR